MTQLKICIIGLGYVGLPLAVEFAKKYKVIGFDIKEDRVNELNNCKDHTLETDSKILQQVIKTKSSFINNKTGLFCTAKISEIKTCNIFVVTVPTPVDKHNRPDLKPLYQASDTAGKALKKGDIVIYESTVFPGATEDECVPVLEKASGLKFNKDFFVGYSPERINPGDKEHTITKTIKVTSGSTPNTADKVDVLYQSIITAGTFKASSIKVAEAAKVIENTQRDINIAFVNELAKVFNLIGIDTNDVLEAAATKWNFLKFKPGLVGGHCIGVDPYYLAQKAQEVGYHPEIILAGRRINDSMGKYVAQEVIKLMIKKDIVIKKSNVLILGITFKENCPDIRNTKVVDIIRTLGEYAVNTVVFDPWANSEEVKKEYNIKIINKLPADRKRFDAIVLAVAHQEFLKINLLKLANKTCVIYDVKSVLARKIVDNML
jgi:UDP-N-acetyl-D-glucosamine/UDP-N-acetyl-D-galactosamine dehydrogenase